MFRLLVSLICILITITSAACESSQSSDGKLTVDFARDLEEKIKLPEGAYELDSYGRYYSIMNDNGRKIIRGVYVHGLGPVGLFVNQPFPHKQDGGCSMVTVTIEFESKKILGAYCNRTE